MHRLPRLIDANLNRTREGLRVCEDIVRFILDDKKLSAYFKSLRHKITKIGRALYSKKAALLKSRNVKKDVGKKTSAREVRRKNIADVFRANIERVKESLRVLEEMSKLLDKKTSQEFKKIRFRVYELEKKSCIKMENITK
ncbi:MAG: thiamine-phosphate pyrophosphorylase [Omnitrophica bacterium]|nr:thiamine-phosphate pyrophosphorylase [Candidatus Omnitrophota bacterium]